jgi:hypothetical protein
MKQPEAPAALYPAALPQNQQFMYGGVLTHEFSQSLITTLLNSPFIGEIKFIANDSLVSRARNTIAGHFLRSKFDWLLFIDSDIEFRHEHVARLWLHCIKHNRRIMCGLYAMKKLAPHFVFNAINGEAPDKDGAVKVAEGGTGFMAIHRSVFEEMITKMPEIAYTTDINHEPPNAPEWDFFAVGCYKYKDSGLVRYLSEDWMFCQRARDLGIDVWADVSIQLKHRGNMLFPPPAQDVATALKVMRLMKAPGLPEEKI